MMGEADKNEIYLSSSPHFASPVTTRHLMLSVVAALLPIAAYGVWLFGIPALMTILVSVASTVASEALFRKLRGRDIRVGDFSAVITGLLLAMVLPPTTPLWMTALGGVFSIVVAKEFFGGLGANVFNPALTGRAFLFISFATPMTTWIAPRVSLASAAQGSVDAAGSASPNLGDAISGASVKIVDAVSAATPLSYIKPAEGAVMTAQALADKLGFSSVGELYRNFLFGFRGGCIGESAIFLILLAGLILGLLKIIDWRAPVAMIVTAVGVSALAGIDPVLAFLSGGLAFGAVFMATDYATSPLTPTGRLLFGAGCGLIAALIRIFGGYPEGVMFGILIMNSLVPHLNKIIVRKYGKARPTRATEASK
jgi:electron transport complex protein RnfD